jgi:beta-glucosidase/6-phospho-beta-glucosidase/beta-galactosidase
MADKNVPFKSFLMGGFECSTHRIRSGARRDLIASTRHDEFAEADYARLLEMGMGTARDGLRWHLMEPEPFRYDFSSLERQIKAARATGIQIVWDYFHYGYPDDLDLLTDEFIERFASFSKAATEYIVSELGDELVFCPVNEISFFSWAAGTAGVFYPFARNRGMAIKKQLVRCHFASIDAVRSVLPGVRWILTEPAIHVVPGKNSSQQAASRYRRAQFQGLDMICGRADPELGGKEAYLDIIGLNYYVHNQWIHPSRRPIGREHRSFKPPHLIFAEYHERYGRPMIVSETGIEDDRRADWFRFVAGETKEAISRGVPLHGLCLYPIVNHPGWEDSRHCHNGLWDYADDAGYRPIHEPLADAIKDFSF